MYILTGLCLDDDLNKVVTTPCAQNVGLRLEAAGSKCFQRDMPQMLLAATPFTYPTDMMLCDPWAQH